MAVAAATGARAAVFDFSTPSGDQGTSHTYTSGGLSTTLTAFGTPAAHLFGKAAGSDENGVGMTNDPSGDTEIAFGKGFIQVDTTGLTAIQFAFNSTTEGEEWSVFGSNTPGVLGSFIVSGTGEGANTAVLPTFTFYDIESTKALGGQNILLKNMTALQGTVRTGGGVPEPATWAMMLIGFGGLGAVLRRRRALAAVPAT
ncbi:MAG TPA: PEPxxWA-CTERM sorting domain-containing protein [Phenylobacterium sp.]|nr:PEPxxWA-CTERM sorting domain-containing protein [Phenylobacterium sp.]